MLWIILCLIRQYAKICCQKIFEMVLIIRASKHLRAGQEGAHCAHRFHCDENSPLSIHFFVNRRFVADCMGYTNRYIAWVSESYVSFERVSLSIQLLQ